MSCSYDHIPDIQSAAEDIFQMLYEVENGRDWKDVWKRLRTPKGVMSL